MLLYSEQKSGKKTSFITYKIISDGELMPNGKVMCPLFQLEEEDYTYFILYDDDMVPIYEAFDYLNNGLRTSPLTTRHMVASALRLLYCFLSLSGKTLSTIDDKMFRELVLFISGKGNNPHPDSPRTERSNNTVNTYLSFYRNYFRYLEIECTPLFRVHNIRISNNNGATIETTIVSKYDANLKGNSNHERSVPPYISPQKFKDICSVAEKHNDKQAVIILSLMYGFGLRLGEVLGLTIEDLEEIEDDEGNPIPVLWLRNRFSDKDFQFAKGLPPVISRSQYKSASYRSAKTKIALSYDFYEQLLDYINEVREDIETNNPNITDLAKADKVNLKTDMDENYYIFLNKHGKILNDESWNERLRKYFVECGIHVDRGLRKNNLNHRFRHGFAMLHARYRKVPVNSLALQKLMRHKSPKSTEVYYNPTLSDQLKDITAFQEEFYEILNSTTEGDANG